MEDCFEDCPSNYSYALHRYDNKPTKVCDYLYKGCSCGRMLLRTMRDLDREGERRKWAKERKKLREEIENLRTVIAGCKHNKLQRSCQRSRGVALRESRKHRPRSEPADITAGTLWREPNGALWLTSLGLGPWARGGAHRSLCIFPHVQPSDRAGSCTPYASRIIGDAHTLVAQILFKKKGLYLYLFIYSLRCMDTHCFSPILCCDCFNAVIRLHGNSNNLSLKRLCERWWEVRLISLPNVPVWSYTIHVCI